MDKRLVKRHKRQVARARDKVKLSEPDLRTPEEITAAKEASRPAGGRHNETQPHYSSPAMRNHPGSGPGSPAKGDV